jgi:MFS transporter, UMF1 family
MGESIGGASALEGQVSQGRIPLATSSASAWGWYLYDCANSAFSTSVLAVFAGPYLTAAGAAAYHTPAPALFSYLISGSVLLRLVTLPVLSAAAELRRRNRGSLHLLAFTGALSTILLGLAGPTQVPWLALFFVLASFGWSGSLVFYNAILPDLAQDAQKIDRISCYGSAGGYLGGGIVLAGHLLFLNNAPRFHLSDESAVRLCIVSSGVWWAVFSGVSFFLLRRVGRQVETVNPVAIGHKTIQDLRMRFAILRTNPAIFRFLAAFSFYNGGAQTVMALAGQFAVGELGMKVDQLAAAILMLQVLAAPFPFLLDRLAHRWGVKAVLGICLCIWTMLLVFTWAWVRTPGQFLFPIAGIASVIAGTQALSRSWYTRLIPRGEEARMFGLYEIAGTAAGWCGPLLFGLTAAATGSYRSAILSISVMFICGGWLLLGSSGWKTPRAPF